MVFKLSFYRADVVWGQTRLGCVSSVAGLADVVLAVCGSDATSYLTSGYCQVDLGSIG